MGAPDDRALSASAPDDDLPVVLLPDDLDLDLDEAPASPRAGAGLPGAADSTVEEIEEELSIEEKAAGVSLPRLYSAIGCVVVAALCVVLVAGWSYYRLPLARRPFHHLHDALRPTGTIGLSMGIAGTLLMVMSLFYLLRKHFVGWSWMGSLQSWMAFHIVAGLVGPALILFHADFVPYSALGIFSFCAMAIVVTSGIAGRYIYVYFPRSLEGRDLELEVIARRLAVYRKMLIDLGVSPSLLQVESRDAVRRRSPWLLVAIVRVLYGDRQNRREFKRLRDTVCLHRTAGVKTRRVVSLVRRLCKERQWLIRYQEIRKLVGAWRFFHRWLAIVLLAAVFFHILIAVNFGDLWIFGGGD